MADSTTGTSNELSSLEDQSARHRASFVETIGVLRDRLTPDSVKAEVMQRVTRAGRTMAADLERKALDHPLRAVAVGAALAYPAWLLMRNVRAPMLLIGAGMALASRGERGPVARSQMGAGQPAARPPVAPQPDARVVETSAASASVGAGLIERAGEAAEQMVEAAQRAATSASDLAATAQQKGRQLTAESGRRAAMLARQGQSGVADVLEKHPLMAGGLGLLIGAAFAATIPPSRVESRTLGAASDRLRRQAKEAALQGFEAARASGEHIVQEVLQEAEAQGLTAEAARDTLKRAGEKARAVADRAAEAVHPEPPAKADQTDL